MASYKKEPVDWITINGNHIPIYKGQSPREAAQAFWKTHEPVTLAESIALKDYTGSAFYPINEYLRGENKGDYYKEYKNTKLSETEIKEKIDLIDSALEKAQEMIRDTIVYRGIDKSILSQLDEGDIYRDKGYGSSSIGEDGYWGNASLVITLPKGTHPGKDLTGESLMLDIEKEFLIKRNAPIKITKKETNKNGRLILHGVYIGK